MRDEVHGLANFYATPAGLVTARLLRDRLRALWPALPGQAVLGLGYASPFLRLWKAEAHRCIALVPEHFPRWRWPRGAASCTAAGPEDALPFPDLTFDRILLVHGLEHAENSRRLLREAWRVLKDDGRLLVVAPNRLGLWAHLERTPFGHGHPYSALQLEALLQRQMFRVAQRDAALFVPPFRNRLLLRGAGGWERLGSRLCPGFAGVTLMEAAKDFSELIPAGVRPARRRVVVAEAA
ncbi:class I SAM-dependent methyltransferase [Siccirubricoccus sp. KC 17139]|uniref:Class I SAM-dependent methyltransferase n=1 Tax=Siccirubricoccus soli TaxID=2899147 RepID=A0ABT1DC68_9PROT|nr:class I SAM-dependent methyltransferase [Siccirubricoccus soli]MCO6419529.1 class I SAM-dependent methyltransferase [Siccirubricoccus soli]MCP2685664.1 class I SAM-dependent methyltransferase [Siccirubricoccus soli]